ncbi:MAG: serine/threonine protein kinase [Myxococcaceae bacterium]|nr:serine/threonine protein kinase [Myxococcaceae bacterium]
MPQDLADKEKAQPSLDAAEMLGKVLDGRYRLEGLLGYGGMGMVFKATQTTVGRTVAIKTLNAALAAAPTFFERFKREAEVASRLKHPNIVTIFDFGKTPEGHCYIAMELVDGDSLRQQVRKNGPMSLRRAAAVIEQIALALQHAHKANVIHRDMKPHNVMVTSIDGAEYVKVLDFGLVKATEDGEEEQLTSTGQVLGTPQYMPPEQASGEPVDARSDLYSLGAVFHFCLTGTSPYGANSVRKALTAALTQPVPSVASKRRGAPVPHAIENFLRKALAKDPIDRYQSADALIADLEASLRGVSDAELDALPERPSGETIRELGSNVGDSPRAATPASRSARSRSRPLPKPQDEKLVPVDRRITAPETPAAKEASAPPPAPAARRGVPMTAKLALVILPVAGLAGAGVAYVLKPPESKPPVVRQQPPPQQPDEPKPPARPDEVEVTLVTTPAGAEVLEDGVTLGKTPLAQRWPRNGVKTVTFQLAGYKDVQKAFKATDAQTFETQLEPVAKKPSGKPVKKDKDSNISAFE